MMASTLDATEVQAGQPVAIVTGAGGAVGREVSLQLGAAGYAVVLCGRTQATLDATASAIAEAAPDAGVLVQVGDPADHEVADTIVAQSIERFGRVDALALVAGYAPLQPIDKIDPGQYRSCIDANLSTVVMLTRAAWPHFKQQKSGVIAVVSSMASIDPFTGFNMYAAAKAGTNLFVKAAADEGKNFNITAVSIAPGAIETPMLREHFPESMLPPEQAMPPSMVAKRIVDCITGERQFKSGATIALPGPQ